MSADDHLSFAGLEVSNERFLPYSPEVVFRAYADPERLKTWWGPKGFSSTFHHFDLRTGGDWRFVLHGPDGANYDNHKTVLEVVDNERIVFLHHGQTGAPEHRFVMTVTLAPAKPDGTQLKWRMVFAGDAQNTGLKTFIEGANEENFDRLEACLACTAD